MFKSCLVCLVDLAPFLPHHVIAQNPTPFFRHLRRLLEHMHSSINHLTGIMLVLDVQYDAILPREFWGSAARVGTQIPNIPPILSLGPTHRVSMKTVFMSKCVVMWSRVFIYLPTNILSFYDSTSPRREHSPCWGANEAEFCVGFTVPVVSSSLLPTLTTYFLGNRRQFWVATSAQCELLGTFVNRNQSREKKEDSKNFRI